MLPTILLKSLFFLYTICNATLAGAVRNILKLTVRLGNIHSSLVMHSSVQIDSAVLFQNWQREPLLCESFPSLGLHYLLTF